MKNFSRIPWNRFSRNALPDDIVSTHFKFSDLTISDTADRLGLDNRFPDAQTVHSAVHLCRKVMEPVRRKFGPYTPNSVYRAQALERVLWNKPPDWHSTSQHTLGQACDLQIADVSTKGLAAWVIDNLTFDQVILECHNAARGKNSGWVHVSLVPPGMGANRKQVLSYVMDAKTGKYVYIDGLHETP